MDPSIIVAGIMAGGTISAQFVIAKGNRKAAEATQQATMDVFEHRIGELEKKVTKHNCFMERLVACESSVKSAHHRIDEVRKDG